MNCHRILGITNSRKYTLPEDNSLDTEMFSINDMQWCVWHQHVPEAAKAKQTWLRWFVLEYPLFLFYNLEMSKQMLFVPLWIGRCSAFPPFGLGKSLIYLLTWFERSQECDTSQLLLLLRIAKIAAGKIINHHRKATWWFTQ